MSNTVITIYCNHIVVPFFVFSGGEKVEKNDSGYYLKGVMICKTNAC